MPTLDTYRKQAKLLQRWHRERNYSVGEWIRRIDRFRSLTDAEVLELGLPLSLAQEAVAVGAGYPTWAALKSATDGAPKTPRAPAGEPTVKGVVPILLVSDVRAGARFFEEKLGFDIDFLHGLPPFYGSVSRNGICLHLRHVHRTIFNQLAAEETSLVCASFEVTHVQVLFEEFKARGVDFVQTLTKQAWGGTDFQVRDPDGNVLSFVTYGRA